MEVSLDEVRLADEWPAPTEAVFVTGASGWLGRHVCAWLSGHGVRVVAALRTPHSGPWSDSWVGSLEEMRMQGPALLGLLGGVRAVIHCAAHVHRPVETDEERALFREVNVDGTEAVIQACRDAGVRRFVYVSTIAGYPWRELDGRPATEDSSLAPATAYAESKIDGEKFVEESDLDWSIVRLSTVFGDGDRANFARLATAMRSRRFPVPGAGSARKSVIPVSLAAEILARLALCDSPRYRIINAALPEAPTLREICDAFSEVCGFPPASSVPKFALRSVAKTAELVARIRGRIPTACSTLDKLTQSTVVNTERLQGMFPDIVWPTFVDALRPAADYYRAVQ